MRKLIPLLTAALVLGAGVGAAQARERDPEAQLARLVQGRVAGEPVSCIDLFRVRSSHVVPGTAIVYDAGSIVYVNRPRNGAEELNRFDTLVTRTPSTQLCSVDVIHTVDLTSNTLTGVVFLGDFVPYRRIRH